jgi:hypothetical protein
MPDDHPWRSAVRDGQQRLGFLRTNQGVMLAVLAPILNGFGVGPHRGAVLIGCLLTATELDRIGVQADAPLTTQAISLEGKAANVARDEVIEYDAFTEVAHVVRDVGGSPSCACISRFPDPFQLVATVRSPSPRHLWSEWA